MLMNWSNLVTWKLSKTKKQELHNVDELEQCTCTKALPNWKKQESHYVAWCLQASQKTKKVSILYTCEGLILNSSPITKKKKKKKPCKKK
jgi:hypothetical protein